MHSLAERRTPAAATAAVSREGWRAPNKDWPRPHTTRRILGRYADTDRIIEVPDSDADVDTDGEHARTPVHTRARERINADGRTARSENRKPHAQTKHARNAPEAGAPLRRFMDSRSHATQEIALLLVLRGWRKMAAAAQMRREELLSMWGDAFEFRRDHLIRRALDKWRSGAMKATFVTGDRYERVQLKLATMHYRQLLSRRAMDQLGRLMDLRRLREEYLEAGEQRQLVKCWIQWRVEYANRKISRLERMADLLEKERADRRKAEVLAVWRRQTRFARMQGMAHGVHKRALLRQAWNVWSDEHVAKRYGDQTGRKSQAQTASPKWRGAASTGAQHRQLQASGAGAAVGTSRLRGILTAWQQLAMEQASLEGQADQFYTNGLVYCVLGRLDDGWHERTKHSEAAARFSRFYCLLRALGEWRHQSKARRDSLLQTRAVRDLVRRRDHKRRRVLVAAWRQVADKAVRAERRADEFARNCQEILVSRCLGHWYASYRFESTQKHITDQGRSMLVPTGANRAAPTSNAYVQTPIDIGTTVVKHDRAISIQTDEAEYRERDDKEKRELQRRVKAAEEEASRYKASRVDPVVAERAQIEREEELDGRLAEWRDEQAARLKKRSLWHIYGAASASRGQRDQQATEQQRIQAEEDSHRIESSSIRNKQLRPMLLKWHNVAQEHSRGTRLADGFYYSRNSPANRRLCLDALSCLRSECRQWGVLELAANKRYEMAMSRKFLVSLYACWDETRRMESLANEKYYRLLISRVWQNWCTTATERVIERTDVIELNHDLDDIPSFFNDSDRENVPPAEAHPAGAGLEAISEQGNDEELAILFGGWHDLVRDVRGLQGDVIERLPGLLQRRAIGGLAEDGDAFDWSLMHQAHLMRSSTKQWRGRLAALRRSKKTGYSGAGAPQQTTELQHANVAQDEGLGEDSDGPRAYELRQCEKAAAGLREWYIKKDALRRWMVLTRGELVAKDRLSKTMGHIVAVVVEHAGLAKLARDKAPHILLRPMIRYWWHRFFIHCARLENADVQANASLVHMCLVRWLSATNLHRTKEHDRGLYMKAVAFRWESEARMALLRWMCASSDKRVKVRLAERSGTLRDARLWEIAESWCAARAARAALKRWRAAARHRTLQRDISMRFAVAWSNANTQRHAIHAWRARTSPNTSMFFSMAGSVEGY
ncbi:hypothetical protein GQ54DRAFT_310417 [Martensiomyces pterosporus]|nr:hypothetical protein GQ54DRAFT_310417 [Martensiomyces pterosporus]